MKTLCRLNWLNPEMNQNEFNDISTEVESFLIKNNLMTDYFGIGNFCINGIPLDIAEELEQKFAATSIDGHKDILETSDLEKFKIGDKVKVFFLNAWAQVSEDKGTILNVEDDKITVRKYRSKTKGYVLQVGQVARLEVGW